MVAVLTACDGFKKEVATGASCADDEIRAAKAVYQSVVYQGFFRQSNSCAGCHYPTGPGTSAIAQLDVDRAYAESLGRLNLNDPQNTAPPSLGYGSVPHGGVNSTYASQNAAAYLNALSTWAQMENAVIEAKADCSSNGGGNNDGGGGGGDEPPTKNYKTIGTVSLNTLFAGVAETDLATFRTVTLSMNSVDPIANGATFTMRMRRFSARSTVGVGSYLLVDPKLSTPRPLRIKDIRVSLIGGAESNASTVYNTVSQLVNTNTAGILLSNAADTLLRTSSETETLKVEILEVGNGNTSCTNLTAFTNDVKPILTTSCTSCHNSTTSVAFTAFRMDPANDAQTCSNLKVRMSNPAQTSMAIIYPSTRTYPTKTVQHPALPAGVILNADRVKMINWYNSEN